MSSTLNSNSGFFDGLSAQEFAVDLLDILIVYYLVYRILLLIKGTRAAQMMMGLAFFGLSFVAAKQLQMTTVLWVLESLTAYIVIIVVIIFQQDIRRGLMHVGRKMASFSKPHEVSYALSEVVDACSRMARARIGAILVFEREAMVKEFIDHGKDVDARLSRELLNTLFVPSRDNELHDGAVIVDKNLRVSLAGAVLPLSRNTNLSQEYGTRHLAALGITEETDAVAVVVSEERGEVSLCYKGIMARDLEPHTLRMALETIFRGDNESDKNAEEAHAAAEIAKAMAVLSESSTSENEEPKLVETLQKETS